MQLEDEQYELLAKFVEAHLRARGDSRGVFIATWPHNDTQATFFHSHESSLRFQGSMSDAEVLAHAGLLLMSSGSKGSSTFSVLPLGIETHKKRKLSVPRVLISYSHDSPEHLEAVRGFAGRLRESGIDVVIDQYEPQPPNVGWPKWYQDQMQSADAIIVVCSRSFERSVIEESGRGVRWEGSLIYQELYGDRLAAARFVPVVFAKSDIKFIPAALRGYTFYVLDTNASFDDLLRRLTGQPSVIRPALEAMRTLPPLPVRNLHGILVFLCYCSVDKDVVRNLYNQLKSDGAKPWLDEEDLLAGQAWQDEIPRRSEKLMQLLSASQAPQLIERATLTKKLSLLLMPLIFSQKAASI